MSDVSKKRNLLYPKYFYIVILLIVSMELIEIPTGVAVELQDQ